MRLMTAFLVMGLAAASPAFAQTEDERLWSCDTSLSGERISVNYVRDEAYRANVGKMESRFARFGKVTCPGYVTLREILRRNEMVDDGSYCLLWDQSSDTFVGAQKGPRKANAVCGKTFCHRVNGAKAAALQEGKAAANAGYEAVTQRPGAAILSAATGPMAGKIEGAGAAAAGLASSPVAVGAVLVGAAATGGALWYCADGSGADTTAAEPLAAPEPYVAREEDMPLGLAPGEDPAESAVWATTLPPPVETAAPDASAPVAAATLPPSTETPAQATPAP